MLIYPKASINTNNGHADKFSMVSHNISKDIIFGMYNFLTHGPRLFGYNTLFVVYCKPTLNNRYGMYLGGTYQITDTQCVLLGLRDRTPTFSTIDWIYKTSCRSNKVYTILLFKRLKSIIDKNREKWKWMALYYKSTHFPPRIV